MKVFLATSYTTNIDAVGNVHPAFRDKVEAIIKRYEVAGREVECDAKEAHWRITPDIDPARAIQLDLEHIKQCDELAALIDQTVSAGVQLEIGFALALRKRITLITEKGVPLNWTNQTLTRFPLVSHLVI